MKSPVKKDPRKPIVSPRVRKGGGLPDGFDKMKRFHVYQLPSAVKAKTTTTTAATTTAKGDSKSDVDGHTNAKKNNTSAKEDSDTTIISKHPTELRGVWAGKDSLSYTATNPVVVWAFDEEDLPPSLTTSASATSASMGLWGYSPGATSTTNPIANNVEDILFIPPKGRLPKSGFIKKGQWTYPVMKRDETVLEEDEAGFIHIGTATKHEKLDVGGEWKLLYHRPGSPFKGKKKKELPPPMNIQVEKPNGERIPLNNVRPDHTIEDIKDMIEEKDPNFPKNEQRLRKDDGTPLDDDDNNDDDKKPTLKDHGIQDGDVLKLDPMIVHVHDDSDGNVYDLKVDPNQTIDQLKDQLESQEGIPTKGKPERKLTYQSKPCIDDKTLRDHGIPHDATLHLLPPMKIHVKTPEGKDVTLDVDPDDTIQSIKKRVEDLEDIPVKEQHMVFHDKPLTDDRATLDDEGIRNNDTIVLEPMIVYVKTPQGKKLTFNVTPTELLQSIKQKVEDKTDIPIDEQRFLFQDKPLPNDKASLKEEGIQHKDTIDMEPMHIIIKDWTGKKFPVLCEPDDTIDTIKDKIEAQEGHPKPIQFLIKGGTFLEDPNTLKSYGIKHKDVVNLDRMKIYVTDWKGKTFTIDVDPEEPINDVKKKIKDREGHPIHKQILQFHGKDLKHPKTLKDYDIQYKNTVYLCKALPKEAPPTPPQSTYTVQLSPYKSPLESTYVSPKGKKRQGIRAKSKDLFKDRWHADLETENKELAQWEEEKQRQKKEEKKKAESMKS